MLKVILRGHNFGFVFQKLGLYLKVKPRFGEFKKFFKNQVYLENGYNSAVLTFLRYVIFQNIFLYIGLTISLKKNWCQIKKKFIDIKSQKKSAQSDKWC